MPPVLQTIEREQEIEWSEECDTALKELKAYISKPPILLKPIEGEIK